MLASDKIATAFNAIVEQAEKLIKADPGQGTAGWTENHHFHCQTSE
jgi:hypothetical protein